MMENNTLSPMTPPNKKRRDGLIWFITTIVLVAILSLLPLSTKVLAQGKNEDKNHFLEIFYDVFNYVQSYYVDEAKIDSEHLMEGALNGLFEALDDPHSSYLTKEQIRELNDTTTGQFGGVGIYIYDTDKGLEVSRPIEGTPAYRAGVSAGDIITAVDDLSIKGKDIDEVIKLLRGKPGTKVTISISRGEDSTIKLTLTRALIEVPTVKSAMLPGGIGYMYLTQFTPLTVDRVREALEHFKGEHYKSLIIDVRNNPGGVLSSVVNIVDYFFEKGELIVYTKSRLPAENQTFNAANPAIVPAKLPIVVLIDKYSASASEILTGALKDTKRAYVIGEKSYGKGSVQQIIPIETGAFKLTVSRYYTPSGITIDKQGIMPDKEVKTEEFTDEEIESFKKIRELGLIEQFVAKNPMPSLKDISTYTQSLQKQGYKVRENVVGRQIKLEQNRHNNNPPIYDLDYDLVLKEAVLYLKDK
jgi:carboxyl-terminal processing protease